MGMAEAVYARLPAPLQHAAITGYGYTWRHRRMGGRFPEFKRGFIEREHYRAEHWRHWQAHKLRELLTLAWRVPHYRDAWSALGLTAADTSAFELEDLSRLPRLEKDPIRRDPDGFLVDGRPGPGVKPFYTSGSTGTPLTTFHSVDDLRRGLAMRDGRYEGFLGVNFMMAHATFRGRVVEPDPDSAGPFHRHNLAERQIYFSPYHLGPLTAGAYARALQRRTPVWMDGYANSIHDLARMCMEQGIELPRLKAIVTTAEPTTDRLREDVARAFGCRPTEDYGMVEEGAMALECEHGSLHVFPDCGYVEILDEQGHPCPAGEVGEIVATSFIRYAQPFIRYRTGDMAAWREGRCSCGREMPMFATVEGRLDDILVGADGRRLGRLSTVPKHLDGVVFVQFVQDRPGAVLVRVVCDGELRPDIRAELERRLITRLGSGMEITIRQVDALERTSRGKIRSVISSVAQRS